MTFFTRPDFSDIMMKQLPDSSISLSGTTDFVGVLKSKGVEIDGSITGATSGNVLTYIDGKIKLAPSEAGIGAIYQNANSVLNPFGDVTGTFFVSGKTFQETAAAMFYPSIPPDATISLQTGLNSRLFGDNTTGNLEWIATRNTNPIGLIEVDGGTGYTNITVIDGNTQTGSTTYIVDSGDTNPVTGTSSTNQSYSLRVTSTGGTVNEVTTSNTVVTWRNKRYWFNDSTAYTSGDTASISIILTGSSSNEFATSLAKTFSPIAFSNEYFYYVYPKHFGVPSFTVNGLPNNAWGNSTASPPTLFEITFINEFSYAETFYVARSDNKLNATFNIVAS